MIKSTSSSTAHHRHPSSCLTSLLPFALAALALFASSAVEGFNNPALEHRGRSVSQGVLTTTTTASTALTAAKGGLTDQKDEEYMRWARQARSAEAGDEIVELPRPLGLILNADAQGNVYVEKVAPKGNAARTGKVKEGDILVMCSATFGDQMWSCRGVGLSRVLAAIRVRSGIVRLVFESPKKYQAKKSLTEKQIKDREDAAAKAQAKKDSLLQELDSDEQGWKSKKKFFGLF